MPSFFQIVANTPLWVWPLMVFVVGLGCYGLRLRTVTPWRLGILPMVGLGTSLAGIVQSARPGLALAGWSLALLAAAPLGYGIGRRRAVRLLDGGRLAIAGGWFMLLFGLSIFAVRYALGVLFGVAPALRVEPFWIALPDEVHERLPKRTHRFEGCAQALPIAIVRRRELHPRVARYVFPELHEPV